MRWPCYVLCGGDEALPSLPYPARHIAVWSRPARLCLANASLWLTGLRKLMYIASATDSTLYSVWWYWANKGCEVSLGWVWLGRGNEMEKKWTSYPCQIIRHLMIHPILKSYWNTPWNKFFYQNLSLKLLKRKINAIKTWNCIIVVTHIWWDHPNHKLVFH